MSWRDDLSADELREIFDRKIAPTLTAGGAAELHPSVVFVGAQPGAGKSRAIADVHSEHPGAVPVIGDDFRAFHPDYRALMRTEPLAMPHVTAQASGAWVGMAADYLRAERRSVILETTMRQLPVVESTAAAFRTQGYRVEAHVLAVPGAVSALGDRRRHRRGARRGDTGPTECRCGGCPRGSGHGRGSGVRRIRRFDRSTCRCRGNGRTGQPRRDCPRPVRGLRDDEKPPARDDDGFRPRCPDRCCVATRRAHGDGRARHSGAGPAPHRLDGLPHRRQQWSGQRDPRRHRSAERPRTDRSPRSTRDGRGASRTLPGRPDDRGARDLCIRSRPRGLGIHR
ncbi:hypothetical protein GCM10010213_29550 [Microbacterium maritypicum]|uniref:UDP-N-acetylglucosamine kinase n=1 Tax=Microbacterium maritypicum TaxID=33918 RepID=A0A4Y4B8W1_MICMQ|nr:hypothetical protein MLI01_29110 [Microbacterium liquefaciens]GGV64330.1 hypothetical protein GCM10010213_29550 [Microbacterium liquefaciens]